MDAAYKLDITKQFDVEKFLEYGIYIINPINMD